MAQVQVNTPECGEIKTNAALYRRKAWHRKIKSLGGALRSKISRNKTSAKQGADKMKRRKIE